MPKHRCAAGIAPPNLLFPEWLPGTLETLHPRRLLVNWHLAWRRRSYWLVSRSRFWGKSAQKESAINPISRRTFPCHRQPMVHKWRVLMPRSAANTPSADPGGVPSD